MYNNLQKVSWVDCHITSIWFYKFLEKGLKKNYVDVSIVKARNVALIVYFLELFLCFFRLGLYSIRRFIFSIIINIVFLILTILATYSTFYLNPYLVLIHWGGVLIAYVIFIILMVATISGSHGDEDAQILAFYIPLLLEAIPLILLLYFNIAISKFQINFEKQEKIRIQMEREDNVRFEQNINNLMNRNNNTNNNINSNSNNFPKYSIQKINDLEKKYSQNTEQIRKTSEVLNFENRKSADLNEESKLCCVCYKERYNNVFIPCGHVCCCGSCAKRVYDFAHKCPICRRAIEKYQKIIEV